MYYVTHHKTTFCHRLVNCKSFSIDSDLNAHPKQYRGTKITKLIFDLGPQVVQMKSLAIHITN